MFELDKQMEQWRSELRASHHYLSSDIDELEAHLLDVLDELKKKGWTEEEAFQQAIQQMGDVDSLSKEFSKSTWRAKIRRPLILSGVAALVLIVELTLWWNARDTFKEETRLIGTPKSTIRIRKGTNWGQQVVDQIVKFLVETRGLDVQEAQNAFKDGLIRIYLEPNTGEVIDAKALAKPSGIPTIVIVQTKSSLTGYPLDSSSMN